ncbi:2Fe-2S iron-sulfur cluster-binding protein [Pseudanabaena sp. PCC 6802]|uniref:2Fe-2S iron-sulfur cluster-binding protein n=1 Tax=Pseudanabaena sp. PCC 6802 TaxID=118173 RepID=UPI000347FFB1|nr:2Fe-2S iron-sulfur cluster-binding protein [Pseudanabaena sp. PCC 6802]
MAVYNVRLINEAEGLDETIEVDEDEFVLDVAEAEGINLPFSCRAGTCSTCAGRVIEGDVKESGGNPDMFFNSGQRAAGFRLLCISYPTSDCTILTNQEPNISQF